jgi:glycosyl transferase family 2
VRRRGAFNPSVMPRNGIVAHLIIGRRREPYLPAVLESIADACAIAVVDDNGGSIPGPNDDFLQSSTLGRSGRLVVVRTPFRGFAAARNACIDATPADLREAWTLFVDADEVHGDELAPDIDAVDGYSRHFVGSFSWWTSVERRLCFFRGRADRRWTGRVHERLEPLGKRVVLPFVWAHYGHVVTPRMEWEKSRLYSSLGQPGFAPTDAELAGVDAALAWGRFKPVVMRFDGAHPPAARDVIEQLTREWASTFADVESMFSRATPLERLRRGLRRANYARLIALRRLEARARWGRIA